MEDKAQKISPIHSKGGILVSPMAELVGPRLYSCYNCRNHVALHDDVISKAFQIQMNFMNQMWVQRTLSPHLYWFFVVKCTHLYPGKKQPCLLFAHAMNIVIGPKEDRQLVTGLHTVADIYCCDCREVLGWKYERAFEVSQKYKEGKYILEKSKIVKENW